MLRVEGLVVRYGAATVLDRVDLEVPDGQVVAVLGPSGCGKTTLLRAVAGLEPAAAGRVFWDGADLEGTPPHARGFGLMFQEYALFPHRSVHGNVAFGLRMDRWPQAEADARVREVLEWVGLAGYGGRSVGALSGGEQQRVALARALAPAPRMLMLDEPLGSLDRSLRERLFVELRRLLTDRGITAVYVTHDQEEAFSVSDLVVVMREGRIAQRGPAEEVWRRPADEWVASFLGFDVVADVRVEDGRIHLPWGTAALADEVPRPADSCVDRSCSAVLRPDAVVITSTGRNGGRVVSRVFKGGHYLLRLQMSDGSEIEAEMARAPVPSVGDQVRFDIEPGGIVLLG
jgi:thiamine transport system ATP-binding protein